MQLKHLSKDDTKKKINLVVYQSDIPQNLGAIIRLTTCLGVVLHIVRPCAFPISNSLLKRVAMDYLENAQVILHDNWEKFSEYYRSLNVKLCLLSTHSKTCYTSLDYTTQEWLVLGRESKGVPQYIHEQVDYSVTIPLIHNARSMNIVTAASMVLGEVMRQNNLWNISK